ncbi:MAG: hypothetical protein V4565_14410 [Bacteroidota bacterium]
MKKSISKRQVEVLDNFKSSNKENNGFLHELIAIHKAAVTGFRLLNKKVKFHTVNIFLLQALTQSKALWEETHQLILASAEGTLISNERKKKTPKLNSNINIQDNDFTSFFKVLKEFDENVIKYYQSLMEEPLHEDFNYILKNQLITLQNRYRRLTALEMKIKSDY